MTSKEVRFLAESEQDATEALSWYLARSIGAALKFKLELDIAAMKISEFPQIYPKYLFKTQKCLLRDFPYAIVFREFTNHIQVFAVASMNRKPGYWKGRV